MEEPLSVLRVWDAGVRRGRALMVQWQARRHPSPAPAHSAAAVLKAVSNDA